MALTVPHISHYCSLRQILSHYSFATIITFHNVNFYRFPSINSFLQLRFTLFNDKIIFMQWTVRTNSPCETHTLGRMQMSTVTIVLLVILVILIAALIGLYFFGKKPRRNRKNSRLRLKQLNKPFPCWLSIKEDATERIRTSSDGN